MMKNLIFLLSLTFLVISCIPNNPNAGKTLKNVVYGTHSQQKMDVYLPANRNENDTKLFIWIHGGAWSSGDKSEFVNFKKVLDTTLNNYAFISLNYRLFDSNTNSNLFPTQENDIQLAMNFIQTKLADWKISDKVVIGGGSAGAHLALLHAYKNNNSGLVKACVAYFPPTELVLLHPANLLTLTVLTGALNGLPADQMEAYNNSSPVNFITSQSVPTLFFHGTADDVVPFSQSELLKSLLEEHNVAHDYLFFDGDGHSFSPSNTITSINRIKQFLFALGL